MTSTHLDRPARGLVGDRSGDGVRVVIGTLVDDSAGIGRNTDGLEVRVAGTRNSGQFIFGKIAHVRFLCSRT